MTIQAILLDLDGTVYPEKNGLWKEIKHRINLYLLEEMGFSPVEAEQIREEYLSCYGTTLRGLQIEFDIDPNYYLNFVHDIPLEKFISEDVGLIKLLAEITVPLWIFTNSDIKHAKRVLELLNIQDYFQGIIDIHALEFVCKPDEGAYRKALWTAGISNPADCLFIDDSPNNIATANRLGFQTVLVSENDQPCPVCFHIQHLHQLPDIFPELWQTNPHDVNVNK